MFGRSLYWTVTLVAMVMVLSPIAPTVLQHAPTPHGTSATPSSGAPMSGAPHLPPSSHASKTALPSTASRAATGQRILSNIRASGVPMKYAYLPNFNAQVSTHGGLVSPTYLHSPAPYGIAAYGVQNTTGNASAYILNSPSYEGAITFNSLDEFYLDDDSTDYIGAQLNTVVSNVTLFGDTNYSFWNQNVITYSARSNLLQFIDNIWNFSSTAFYMSPNVFNQTGPNGTLVAPSFYYALGPVINVTMPFTLHLYINATTTNVNGFPDDIVYFNYTVIKTGFTVQAGTFDWAIFNSQNPASPRASIPAPMYQLNGFYPSPTGYLPYESELVFCGPGGGSTTTVNNIDATLNLWYLNTTTGTYQNVPSAVAYGTNTGETIEGATEWFDASNTVHVGPGPTLPFPLWNSSPTVTPGHIDLTGTITPDTSFVFLNQSATFNYSWAAYAPVPIGGAVDYQVPIGSFVGEVEMSNYDPATINVVATNPSTWTIATTLTADAARGLYTPLIAWSNAQLAELAVAGAGTLGNPYIMPNDAVPSVDPIFGSINDFAFPVFPGVLFAHTTAYVLLNSSSNFHIDYGGRVLDYMNTFGYPTWNNLQFQFYGTSHVSLVNTSDISGWISPNQNGFPITPVMAWNSTSTLIAHDVFSIMGTSLLLYGGTANTVFGNWFNSDPSLANPAVSNVVLFGTFPFGPQVYENGDLLFNNAFLTQIPAYSPASTIYLETFYSAPPAPWVDSWNVSAQPANDTWLVNGITLTGSIVNGSYLGGNLWWDYAPGAPSLPFSGGGLIAVGGDWLPITGDALTFSESGLPAGSLWGFVLDGITVQTFSSTVVMSFFDGTFSWSLFPVPGYSSFNGTGAPISAGTVTLLGAPGSVSIGFVLTPETYDLAFTETGLPGSSSWSVTVNGVPYPSSTPSTIVVPVVVPVGGTEVCTWTVAPVAGLIVSPPAGTSRVSDTNVTVAIAFLSPAASTYSVAFVETGLTAGSSWSVTLAGTQVTSMLDVISFTEPNGSYAYSVSNVTGYSVSPATSTATVSGGSDNNAVTYAALPVTLSGTYSPSTAQVWVDGAAVTPTTPGNFTVHVAPGTHAVRVSASGYFDYSNNVTIGVGGSSALSITLHAQSTSTTSSTSGLTGSNLALLAGVALLALIFLIGMVYFWSRARRPPVMMKPEPPAGASRP